MLEKYERGERNGKETSQIVASIIEHSEQWTGMSFWMVNGERWALQTYPHNLFIAIKMEKFSFWNAPKVKLLWQNQIITQ